MAQSVELLLDAEADTAVRDQWAALAAAGLPTEDRSGRPDHGGGRHHRPHLTLYAADRITTPAEATLPAAVAGLDIDVVVGSVLIFGPRRGRCILVRLVVPSAELLAVQGEVAGICDADRTGQFGPGRWVPHVTLARRVPTEQVGSCLALLGERPAPSRITRCRRWDGDAKTAWLL